MLGPARSTRPAHQPWIAMPANRTCLGIALCLVATVPARAAAQDTVSFRNEVMAVLSRAGCNQGACHGNLNGKGGFKLSLRGENPEFDRNAMTRDALGRRVDPHRPEQSLVLRKPAGQAPHEGGLRFPVGSPEYEILRRWIAAGMQPDSPGTPVLKRLEVTPVEEFLVQPANDITIRAR